jgi:hypothetical protein
MPSWLQWVIRSLMGSPGDPSYEMYAAWATLRKRICGVPAATTEAEGGAGRATRLTGATTATDDRTRGQLALIASPLPSGAVRFV